MTKRWLIAIAGAVIVISGLFAAVRGLDWMRTTSKIESCLDRAGAWDYDARACQAA